MDFSQVKGIRITPGLEVKNIIRLNPTLCYWKRPFTFPTIGYAVYSLSKQGDTIHRFAVQSLLEDKYTVTYKNGVNLTSNPYSSPNTDGSKNDFFLLCNIWLPGKGQSESMFTDGTAHMDFIPEGLKNKLGLVVFYVANENEADNFPFASPSSYYSYAHTYTSYTFSDASTGKIKLSAVKDTSISNRSIVTEGRLQRNQITAEIYQAEITRDTDVEVTAGKPLITLGNNEVIQAYTTLIIKKFASVRDDFEEYKVKYDTATGSKFPKSEYPYLLGYTKLTASYGVGTSLDTSNAIKNVGAKYFYFIIPR